MNEEDIPPWLRINSTRRATVMLERGSDRETETKEERHTNETILALAELGYTYPEIARELEMPLGTVTRRAWEEHQRREGPMRDFARHGHCYVDIETAH